MKQLLIMFYIFYAYSAARVFSSGNLVDDFTAGLYISKLGELAVKGGSDKFIVFDHKSEVFAKFEHYF